MRMGQGVRTGLEHGDITYVLQTQFSSFNILSSHLVFKHVVGLRLAILQRALEHLVDWLFLVRQYYNLYRACSQRERSPGNSVIPLFQCTQSSTHRPGIT